MTNKSEVFALIIIFQGFKMFKNKTYFDPVNHSEVYQIHPGAVPSHLSQKILTWFAGQDLNTKKSLAKKLNKVDVQFFYSASELPVGIVTARKQYLATKLFCAVCKDLCENFSPFSKILSKLYSENTDAEINIRILSSLHRIKLENYLPWENIADINEIVKKNSGGKTIEDLLVVDSNFAETIILSNLRFFPAKIPEDVLDFFDDQNAAENAMRLATLIKVDYKPALGFLKQIIKDQKIGAALSENSNEEINIQEPKENLKFSKEFTYKVNIPSYVIDEIKKECDLNLAGKIGEELHLAVEKNIKPILEKEIENKITSYVSDAFRSKVSIATSFLNKKSHIMADGSALLIFTIKPEIDVEIKVSEKIMDFLKVISTVEKEFLVGI
jgi:hypothetical protein